ncbi:MAG: alpha/beta hydrolase [Bacteroidia bacterium]
MHKKNIKYSGVPIESASKALIMLHGRGANANDILSVAGYLNVDDFALIAPEATHNTWYPYSFMVPTQQNEPWLTSALRLIQELINELYVNKIHSKNIYLLGFSQGACLALEFICRNAIKYGGAIAFTGGLIGDKIIKENYKGDFNKTPVFIGTSDPDMHVPVSRVEESAETLKYLNADVHLKIYKDMGHTINEDEIKSVNELIFK